MFLRRLVRWRSIDIQVKFYGDRPRRTAPSMELNIRGVAEYSDFGPIERYILEKLQDIGRDHPSESVIVRHFPLSSENLTNNQP